MLSNAYFLAKFRFDTAENEPSSLSSKNISCLNLLKFRSLLSYGCVLCAHARRAYALEEPAPPVGPRRGALVVGIFSARSNVGLR